MNLRQLFLILILMSLLVITACSRAERTTSNDAPPIISSSPDSPIYKAAAHTVSVLPTGTPTPMPAAYSPPPTPEVIVHYLDCQGQGVKLRCYDPVLGMQFDSPSRWGFVGTRLTKESCGKITYVYHDWGSGELWQASGQNISSSCPGRGGDLLTQRNQGFHVMGSQPGDPTDACLQLFPDMDCRYVQKAVVLAIGYPMSAVWICQHGGGPGLIPIPLVFIAIDLPLERQVHGFAFAGEFLSVKTSDWLLEPLNGQYWGNCENEQAIEEFDRRLVELRKQVQSGEVDEETAYKLQQWEELAQSIQLLQP